MSLNPYSGPDALLNMATQRRSYLFFAKAEPDTLREYLSHHARGRYLALRHKAMRPVDLPSDSAHLVPSADTCDHFNALARAA